MPKGDRANGDGDDTVTIVKPRVVEPSESVPGSFGGQDPFSLSPSPLVAGRINAPPPPAPSAQPTVKLPSEDPNSPYNTLKILQDKAAADKKAADTASKRWDELFPDLIKRLNKPPPAPPDLQRVREPPPDFKQYQKGTGMFLAASGLLAAVAGSKSRQGLTLANNAFAAAADGWQQGNQLAYKNAVADWNNRADQVATNNRIEQAKYQNILNNDQMNIDRKIEAIKVAAVEEGNHTMHAAAEAGNMLQIGKTLDAIAMGGKKWEAQAEVNRAQQTAADSGLALNAAQWRQWVAEGNDLDTAVNPKTNMPFTDGEKAGIRQNMQTFQPLQTGPGGRALAGNIPRTAPAMYLQRFREQFRADHGGAEPGPDEISEAMGRYYGQTAEARVRQSAAARADASALSKARQQQAAILSFERTAIANAEVLVDLAKKVDKTGKPILERWIRAGRQATGDPVVAEFNFQWTNTNAEIARIIAQPNMAGVLSDSARHEMQASLPSASSAQQVERVVKLAIADMKRREAAIEATIAEIEARLSGETPVARPTTAPARTSAPASSDDPAGILGR
jgi:hypothetical protein